MAESTEGWWNRGFKLGEVGDLLAVTMIQVKFYIVEFIAINGKMKVSVDW